MIVAVDIALVAALWLWALWGSSMRTPQTVGLLLVATLAYVVSSRLAIEIGVAARVVVLVSTAWLLLLHTDRFVGMSAAVRDFDRAYEGLLAEVSEAADRRSTGELDTEALIDGLNGLAGRLEGLPAPDRDWRELQMRTVRHIRSQAIRYKSAQSSDELDRAVDAGDEESVSIRRSHSRLHSWRRTWTSARGRDSTAT